MTDLRKQSVELLAKRAALGNNGGDWAEHYTEAQKEHWRDFARDLIKLALEARCLPVTDQPERK